MHLPLCTLVALLAAVAAHPRWNTNNIQEQIRHDMDRFRERSSHHSHHSKNEGVTAERRARYEKLEKMMEHDENSIYAINKRAGVVDGLFEGDILLTEEDMDALWGKEDGKTKRSSSIVHALPNSMTWNLTKGPIQYTFNVAGRSYPEHIRDPIREGIRMIEENTCLRFQEVDHIAKTGLGLLFHYGKGCQAAYGAHSGGTPVSIGPSCDHPGVVVHEISHSLGFAHTQSRSDRNAYVDINIENVETDKTGNFDPHYSDNELPYDYGSVMHYAPYNFAIDKSIMTTDAKDDRYDMTIGQIDTISFYDWAGINKVYKCSDRCYSDSQSARCENGGYPHPHDCTKCMCPLGFGGNLCTEKDKPGPTLMATEEVQTAVLDKQFTYWIQAPCDKKVAVTFTQYSSVTTFKCVVGCQFGYWNVKSEDPRESGFRVCCDDHINKTSISNKNMFILTSPKEPRNANYTITYKAV